MAVPAASWVVQDHPEITPPSNFNQLRDTTLPRTDGLFIQTFEDVATKFDHVTLEFVRVDTLSSSLPQHPDRYPLIATTNLFGDILSDQASGLAGGVGLAPSLNVGMRHAMAQAVHGTAPDIAGTGTANPTALILSTALLMGWFGQQRRTPRALEIADLIESGVSRVLGAANVTAELGGSISTMAFADSVVDTMHRNAVPYAC